MRTPFHHPRTLPGTGFLLLLLFLLTPRVNASSYSRDVGGNFDDPVWTRGALGTDDYAKNVGPPGAGDTAGMSGGAVTATSGAVQYLSSTVDFTVTGSFSAGTYSSNGALMGGGTLTANNIGAGTTIEGGHLVVPGACNGSVTLGGGSFHAGSYSAHNLADAGGKVTIDSAATDLNAQVTGGGSLTVPSIKNGRDISLELKDAGSSVTVASLFTITAGYLEISGGTLTVQSDLFLDGGTDFDGDPIGGGGSITGKDAFVSVARTFAVGASQPAPGFGLTVAGGATVSCGTGLVGDNAGASGTLNISGAGTVWNSDSSFVSAYDGTGEVTMDTGARLHLGGSGSILGVGLGNGSDGSIEADGTGTTIDAGGAVVTFGKDAGSHGRLTLDDGASLLLGNDTRIGDGGDGGLYVNGGSQASAGVGGAAAKVYVGGAKTGLGSVSIQGAGSRFVTGDRTTMNIGSAGYGFFGAGNGATVQTARVAVGSASTANGQIVLDGTGTTWTNTYLMGVGGIPIAGQQGPGKVTVQNGAVMRTGAKSPGDLFISRSGQVVLDATGRIAVGAGAVGAGGTLRVSAPGILCGKGKQSGTAIYNTSVTGKVIVGAGGKFRPGSDPDVFSIQGDCDLSDGGANGGETDFELGGAGTAGTDYDQLVVSGKATLGGTLRLVLLPGYKPKAGDRFSLVKAGSVAGGFAQVVAPGLTVNPAPGAGTLSVTVTAVAAMDPPAVTSVTTAEGIVGEDFSYRIAATNTPAGYTATGLPDGLEFDPASGLVTGMPTTAGTYQIALSATNVAGTGTAKLVLTVAAASANGVPTITSPLNATAQAGAAFSYQITATGSPTSYSVENIPATLVLNGTSGLLTGSVTTPGTYKLILHAANAKGTGTATLTLTVTASTATVTATAAGEGMAFEGGAKGKVFVRRTGDVSAPLTVFYKAKGTARASVDYVALPGSVTIPAGAAKGKIKIKAIDDAVHESTRKLKIKLLPAPDNAAAYLIGDPSLAKIKIIDND